MAFTPATLTLWSNPIGIPTYGLPQWWGYLTTDNMATVGAAGYFNITTGLILDNSTFHVGDLFYCVCSDGNVTLQISAIAPNVLTVFPQADIAPGSITHAMLGLLIVQAGNIAANTITNAQVAANTFSDGQIAAHGLSAPSLALSVPQTIRVPIASANFKTAYTAGLAMIPAGGANTIVNIIDVYYTFGYLTAAYTGGGLIQLQYSTAAPVNAAGIAASVGVAAVDVTGLTAAGYERDTGVLAINGSAGLVNAGVWFTVATANFAAGSGALVANITYNIITV